jgi:hypothetical protein
LGTGTCLLISVLSFLSNFAKKPFTTSEQIKLIHDFLKVRYPFKTIENAENKFISQRMEECEPWKSQNEAEFDNAMEAMEKLVMNRLYNL